MTFKTVWTADPQDHSGNARGFQGNYFSVRGVTDRDHASLADVERIMARRRQWRRIASMSGFDAVYQWHDWRPKFLCIGRAERVVS